MTEKNKLHITTILKRDGRKEPYDRDKITMATWQSLWAVAQVKRKFPGLVDIDDIARLAADIEVPHEKADKRSPLWKEADRLARIVEDALIRSNPPQLVEVRRGEAGGSHLWKVEEIQDIREQTLLAADCEAEAKAYIFYRNKKSLQREARQVPSVVKNDLGMSENALAAMARRYLRKDKNGNVIETPKEAMRRVATAVANAEARRTSHVARTVTTNHELRTKNYWKDRFLEIMTSFEFVPAGCYFRGAGNKQNGSLANCFVLPVEDSIEQIFDAVKWSALIHQMGGGTGFNFSHLRPRGDVIGSGGLASGPINFMKAFDAETQIVMQGGEHRGANMGILNIDHPDIFEFIRAKSVDGEVSNFNVSVGAFDRFMEVVETDRDWALVNPRDKAIVQKIPARQLWNEIIRIAHTTGDPGMIYLDAINRTNPVMKQLGPIESTNVCISGDTRIATEKGLLLIREIARRFPDGGLKIGVDQRSQHESLRAISRAVSSGRKKTIRVTTKAGYSLVCTPDHQIMTEKGWTEARQLVVGQDKLFLQQCMGVFSQERRLPIVAQHAFQGANGRTYEYRFPSVWGQDVGLVLGWLIGDGWLRDKDKNCRVGFTFGRDSQEAFETVEPILQSWYTGKTKTLERRGGVKHLSFHSKFFCEWFKGLGVEPVRAEKKRVPESIFSAPREAVVGFLKGLFSSDGTVRTRNDGSKSYWVCLTSKSRMLLQDVQLLLLQFGIQSNIYDRSRKPRSGMFPYITTSGKRVTYRTDGKLWELGIFGQSRERFREAIGFLLTAKQQKLEEAKDQKFYRQEFTDIVISVEDNGIEEVFDLTEPVSHSMLANGLYIHNCGEQPLHPFDVCNLGSINLSKFVIKPFWENRNSLSATRNSSKKRTDSDLRIANNGDDVNWSRLEHVIRTAVRFLDDGIDASTYPIPQIGEMAHQLRRIGLGVMGWADMLSKIGVKYDSDEGVKLAEKIMKFIQDISWDESGRLAEEKEEFPLWKGSYFNGAKNPFGRRRKVRNVAVTTIAPTGTISMIADCSSGIEPYFALEYTKNVVEKEGLKYTNKYYEEARRALSEHSEYSDNQIIRKSESRNVGHSDSLKLRHSDFSGTPSIQSFLKSIFRTAHEIEPEWHVRMQAAFQKYTDNAVSKTINFPKEATVKDVERAYMLAWKLGCKGITVYRDGSRSDQILSRPRMKDEGQGLKEEKKKLMQSQLQITPLSQRAYQVERLELVEESMDGHCPECGTVMEEVEGCSLCRNCGYSRCSL